MDTTDRPAPAQTDGSSRGDRQGDGSSQDGSESSSQNGSQKGPQNGDAESGADESQKKNALEWAVFAVGVAITLGVMGYLVYEVVTETNAPPDLQIALTEQRDRGPLLEVDVEVENSGDVVAEGAVIEVCGGPDACAELAIPYVPAGSRRSGTVSLNKPLSGPLETRAVSFRQP